MSAYLSLSDVVVTTTVVVTALKTVVVVILAALAERVVITSVDVTLAAATRLTLDVALMLDVVVIQVVAPTKNSSYYMFY